MLLVRLVTRGPAGARVARGMHGIDLLTRGGHRIHFCVSVLHAPVLCAVVEIMTQR